MNTLTFFTVSTVLCTSLFASSTQCGGIYPSDTVPDIINPKLVPQSRELCYSSFALMHSGISRTALWSAEHLTREGLRHKNKRTNDFHPEAQLNPQERAELSDYARSGYDRGHMAPAADMPTVQAERECFSLANMVPQNSENNRGIWSAIEGATRHMANVKGDIYVITGPIFSGSSVQRIGGRVLVPSKLYKAIYDPSSGLGAAYVSDNAPGDDYRVVSIAEIERMSGINLFPGMDPSMKEKAMPLPDPEMRSDYTRNTHEHNSMLHFLEKLLRRMDWR